MMAQIQALVVRMAAENRTCGCPHPPRSAAICHHRVARGTIANFAAARDRAATDQKQRTGRSSCGCTGMCWPPADFFTVEVWTGTGLTRFAVFFVVALGDAPR